MQAQRTATALSLSLSLSLNMSCQFDVQELDSPYGIAAVQKLAAMNTFKHMLSFALHQLNLF